MINRKNRPYFMRSGNKEKNQEKGEKFLSLIALILRRIINKNLKKQFQQIKNHGNSFQKALTSMTRIANKSLMQNKILYWKQLKFKLILEKRSERIIKRIDIINQNYNKWILKLGFGLISQKQKEKEKKQVMILASSKGHIFGRLLKRLFNQRLRDGWNKINLFKQYKNILLKEVVHLSRSFKKIQRKSLQFSLNKMMRVEKNKNKNSDIDLKGLKKKLSELNEELLDKEKRNGQFQKQEVNYKDYTKRSSSQNHIREVNSKRSLSSEKEDKKSDYSVGSFLNGSFFTWKSGKSSRHDSASGAQCFCKYREKYNHYKCETLSLKNQLQIMKRELEVTKDLNDHFQNQFSDYFNVEDNSGEIERLKQQIKELKKERQNLRDKLVKYQKCMTNMKYQFKVKLENLYRKVRKN